MRLIDADAIDLGHCRGGVVGGVMFANLSDIADAIKAAPTTDPIRAAGGCRCGECKNYVDAYGTGEMMCMRPVWADDYSETGYIYPLELDTKEADFCSYGEPRGM